MGIEMPDGTRLSARVWMPEDALNTPVPVILEHLPYRKRDGTIVRDEYSHPWMAGHGYCCIRTDMRGSGDSEGLMEDEYTAQELQDACDVIAWAAAQPWCNGNVGMQGISWGGFNSLQVAALKPPALKAIITICSTVDRYADDIHYKGGCLLVENFGRTLNWWVTKSGAICGTKGWRLRSFSGASGTPISIAMPIGNMALFVRITRPSKRRFCPLADGMTAIEIRSLIWWRISRRR